MDLTGDQTRRLQEALFSAFPTRGALARMVDFELDTNLEFVAGGENYADVVFNLIQWAEAQGKVQDLVAGARTENPGNPKLLAIAQELFPAIYPPTPPAQPAFTSSLVRTIGDEEALYRPFDVARVWEWAARMRTMAQAVCRIEMASSLATGFLVGPDLVLTCHHNIAHLLAAPTSPGDVPAPPAPSLLSTVRLRFGYILSLGQAVAEGQAYSLAPDWLVDGSPYEDYNYALLRVAGTPGLDDVPQPDGPAPRHWLTLSSQSVAEPAEPMFVLHHASAGPLKTSFVTNPEAAATIGRVNYNALTEPGSSGAPICTLDGVVVAIHEGRQASVTPDSDPAALFAKVGVRADAIVSRLTAAGISLGP